MKRVVALMLAGPLLLAAAPSQAAVGQAAPASAVIGAPLVGPRGEPAGVVEDLVFDARTGAILWAVSGGLAYALETLAPEVRAAQPPARFTQPRWPAMRASSLFGKEVVDREHRDFGEIRDLVLDREARRVRAAVVDRRDDWAPGKALVSVPIEAFSLPRDLPDKVALNYSRERFE